jgi:hypothetical protein
MEKVSFKKVLKNDSFTVSLLLITVIFAIMLVIFVFMPSETGDLAMYLILGFDGIGMIILGVRLVMLLTFKADRKVYKAKVIKTFTYRSSRHIKFVYTIAGVEYTKKNVLFTSKFSRALGKDDEVEIYISESNPAKALIKEAYFETEVL